MFWQDYRIGTARKTSVDIEATPDLLLLIQQKLRSTDTEIFPRKRLLRPSTKAHDMTEMHCDQHLPATELHG